MNVLLTGASGFVGRGVGPALIGRGHHVVSAVRREMPSANRPQMVRVGDIHGGTDWRGALAGIDVVVHLAGRAHVRGVRNDTASFTDINVAGTMNLARQAARAKVRRLVFISSIGVNGSESSSPFKESDSPDPSEAYAVSKLRAENELFEFGASEGMEVVVIRPPLIYGPAAPGNFGALVAALRKGMPLPLGAVHNRRTLIGRANLADLICCCVEHPAAANEVFLAGDAEDVSTSDFLRRLGSAMNRPARLIPVPVPLLEKLAGVVGRRATIRKICGDLRVDTTKAECVLGWRAPFSLDEGLSHVVAEIWK